MYEDTAVIGYWVKRHADKPHQCVLCTTCAEPYPAAQKITPITWGEASAQDEPPLCIECGLYLPTVGEP